MREYARIEENIVMEFLCLEDGVNTYDIFSSELVWVDITDHTTKPQVGWYYIDENFKAPEPVYTNPLPELRAELEYINRNSISLIRTLLLSILPSGENAERDALEKLECDVNNLLNEITALS